MNIPKGQYLVDSNGRPKAVVLSLKDYKKMLRLFEDIRDASHIRRRRHEKLISMEQVHRNLTKEKLV